MDKGRAKMKQITSTNKENYKLNNTKNEQQNI